MNSDDFFMNTNPAMTRIIKLHKLTLFVCLVQVVLSPFFPCDLEVSFLRLCIIKKIHNKSFLAFFLSFFFYVSLEIQMIKLRRARWFIQFTFGNTQQSRFFTIFTFHSFFFLIIKKLFPVKFSSNSLFSHKFFFSFHNKTKGERILNRKNQFTAPRLTTEKLGMKINLSSRSRKEKTEEEVDDESEREWTL